MEGDILLGSYETLTTRQNRGHIGLFPNFSKFHEHHELTISSKRKGRCYWYFVQKRNIWNAGGKLDMKNCFRRMGSFYFEKYWDLYFR